jgi:hypothetical protein
VWVRHKKFGTFWARPSPHLYPLASALAGPGMMSLMSGTLGMHRHASEAEGHRARGSSKALLHRKVGLEPQDTW